MRWLAGDLPVSRDDPPPPLFCRCNARARENEHEETRERPAKNSGIETDAAAGSSFEVTNDPTMRGM